jgi:hypothetical protein
MFRAKWSLGWRALRPPRVSCLSGVRLLINKGAHLVLSLALTSAPTVQGSRAGQKPHLQGVVPSQTAQAHREGEEALRMATAPIGRPRKVRRRMGWKQLLARHGL